jgi:hypothetical protein
MNAQELPEQQRVQKALGEQIRSLPLKKGWSQKVMADLSGLNAVRKCSSACTAAARVGYFFRRLHQQSWRTARVRLGIPLIRRRPSSASTCGSSVITPLRERWV